MSAVNAEYTYSTFGSLDKGTSVACVSHRLLEVSARFEGIFVSPVPWTNKQYRIKLYRRIYVPYSDFDILLPNEILLEKSGSNNSNPKDVLVRANSSTLYRRMNISTRNGNVNPTYSTVTGINLFQWTERFICAASKFTPQLKLNVYACDPE